MGHAAAKATARQAAQGALFGVETSLKGQRWALHLADLTLVSALAQRFEMPEIAARVMAARGQTLETAQSYLTSTLRADLPDPSVLIGMDEAAARIAQAIEGGEKITVFGDYDVDGATSAACLLRFFSAVGASADAYIPDRQKEGYGPNAAAMQTIAQNGATLAITVDCGIQSHEALTAAKNLGLDVIILDHHKADAVLPPCVSAVNPNRQDDTSGLGYLAAVGVVFLTIIAVQRVLRAGGFFSDTRKEFSALDVLDLVALGTVADVAPLIGVNRLLVRQGLKVMAQRRNLGLRALGDVARLDERPDAGHLGFVFGPRVNAGGRVGEASLGTRLLSTHDPQEAADIAAMLDGYNQERRAIEADVTKEALACIGDPGDAPILVASGEGWHPGVIGIVASRLKERFGRPAIVIGFEGETGKGSGRSISGVDLGNAIIDARRAGHLLAGGGHAMAAGLTLERQALPAFKAHLETLLSGNIAQALETRALVADAIIAPSSATPALLDSFAQLAPFGTGNPSPKFAIEAARLDKVDVVGTNHVRMFISDAAGGRLKAMAFAAADTALGGTLLAAQGKHVHFIGRLKRDDWGSVLKAELHVEDAALA